MKNKKIITLVALCAVSLGKEAIAKEFDNRFYVAPSASYLWLDEDRFTSRSGYGVNLALGKAISEDFNLELKGTYNRLANKGTNVVDGRDQWDTFGATVDLQYYFSRNDIAPYLVAGAGVMDSNVNSKNAVGLVGEAGAGIAYKLNDRLSLRTDVRYRYNNNFNNHLTSNNSDEYNDMVVNVGFVIPFGNKSHETKKVAKISDLDSDKDGVLNDVDKCPDTKIGTKVDVIGCKLGVNLVGVNFKIESAELTLVAKESLNKLSQDLISNPQGEAIEVQGHTSSDGNAQYNMILSQKRAQKVANYLANQGVKNKITAKGYGEERLMFDESKPDGRAKNRRVEISRELI